MSQPFSHIQIENQNYPAVIMGEDSFFGWKNPAKRFASEGQRALAYTKCLNAAYSLGVRGFSISPHDTLVKVLSDFKSSHSDIICIANPHANLNYYYDGESIWHKQKRTKLVGSVFSAIEGKVPDLNYHFGQSTPLASQLDHRKIQFDSDEFSNTVELYKSFCNFCIVGNLCLDALIVLGRTDVVDKQIAIVRSHGLVPIGLSELGSLTLPVIKGLGLSMSWVNLNYGVPPAHIDAICRTGVDLTAYRVLSAKSNKEISIEKSFDFILKIPTVKSIVVGVDEVKQAQQNFSILQNTM